MQLPSVPHPLARGSLWRLTLKLTTNILDEKTVNTEKAEYQKHILDKLIKYKYTCIII